MGELGGHGPAVLGGLMLAAFTFDTAENVPVGLLELISESQRVPLPAVAARLLTALAQALFWAVMGPVAVGLFAAEVRGRVVAAHSVAGSLAFVLGVPVGIWLGRQSHWQVPVAVLAFLGLVSLLTIAVLLPTSCPGEEPAPTEPVPMAAGSGSCWRPGPCRPPERSRDTPTS